MKKKYILIILFFFALRPVFSIDCRDITKRKDFEMSDYVFLGQIEKVGKKYIKIRPYEYFKGTEKDYLWAINYEQGFGYYSYSGPKDTAEKMWIFYADSVSGDTISVFPCGWSSSIYSPLFMPPPPQNPNQPHSQDLDYLTSELWRVSARQEMILDIESYRAIRKKEISEKEKAIRNKTDVTYPNQYLFAMLVLISLLLITIIIQNFRKR